MKQILVIVALLAAGQSWADGRENLATSAANPKWKAECGACHLAYPPALLPERSWRKIMSGLERHFGQDASLDAATAKEITDFLANNSADRAGGKRGAKVMRSLGAKETPLRISETSWFVRKHDEVPPQAWKRPKVGSAANCTACHPGAERGDYSEHQVRIPS